MEFDWFNNNRQVDNVIDEGRIHNEKKNIEIQHIIIILLSFKTRK